MSIEGPRHSGDARTIGAWGSFKSMPRRGGEVVVRHLPKPTPVEIPMGQEVPVKTPARSGPRSW